MFPIWKAQAKLRNAEIFVQVKALLYPIQALRAEISIGEGVGATVTRNQKCAGIALATFMFTAVVGCGVSDSLSSLPLVKRHSARHSETAIVRNYVPTCGQPILEAAKCVTEFEDNLRCKGTIAVKTPDVWGDSNLMHSIQEFDNEMKGSLDGFNESFQAYVASSDRGATSNERNVSTIVRQLILV